jgi:hypothetical protein
MGMGTPTMAAMAIPTTTHTNAARDALAKAVSVDEIKNVLNKEATMRAYAEQAKDPELIELATELRKRAERRLGEMMATQPKATSGEHGGHAGTARCCVCNLGDCFSKSTRSGHVTPGTVSPEYSSLAPCLASLAQSSTERPVIASTYLLVSTGRSREPAMNSLARRGPAL